MVFDILQARSTADAADPLYPVPGPTPNSFVLDPDDGRYQTWACTAAVLGSTVKQQRSEIGRVENVKGSITLTESRFVFSCTQFQTGGGWRGYGGGAAIALAANAISKAVAVRGTRGYTLVGHVRHEWLRGVAASNKAWGRSQNNLRLVFDDPTVPGATSRLTVFPPNAQRAEDIAFELVKQAAAVRARIATEGSRAEREVFAQRLPSKPLESGNGRSWILPD